MLGPGSILDNRYRLLDELGRGAMGTVYLAEDIEIKRTVAIKVLNRDYMSDQSVRKLEREARALSEARHSAVVQIYSIGLHAGVQNGTEQRQPFIVMEYVAGRPLDKLLSNGALSAKLALSIAAQVCDGMDMCHSSGIIHRDLKPANIVFSEEDGRCKILDFGVATNTQEQARRTQSGALVGTSLYISPEQCHGQKADHKSDIYSMGCILYEMLTGQPPFTGETPISLFRQHATKMPVLDNLDAAELEVAGIKTIVSKALQKDPAKRYQTMAAMSNDIKKALDGQGSDIRTVQEDAKTSTLANFCAPPAILLLMTFLSVSMVWGISTFSNRDLPQLPVNHTNNKLSYLEAQAARAEARLEEAIKTKRVEALERLARIAFDRLQELEHEYAQQGRSAEAINTCNRRIGCIQYLSDRGTARTNLHLSLYLRYRSMYISSNSPAERLMAQKGASEQLEIARQLQCPSVETQCCILEYLTFESFRKSDYEQSKKFFEQLRSMLTARAYSVEQPHIAPSVPWQFKRSLELLKALLTLPCQSDADRLTLAEMLVPLCKIVAEVSHTDGKKYIELSHVRLGEFIKETENTDLKVRLRMDQNSIENSLKSVESELGASIRSSHEHKRLLLPTEYSQ